MLEQLKKKGEVFTVLPNGSVIKVVSSFREIFEAYEDTKTDWEVAFEEEILASRRKRNEDRKRRERRKNFACRLYAAGATAIAAIIFI